MRRSGARHKHQQRDLTPVLRRPVEPALLKRTSRAKKGCMLRTIVPREIKMARMFVDCRNYPSEKNCTVAISADTEKELLDAAVQHAVAVITIAHSCARNWPR
jgi:Protein of unknown function (DUF1059)